MSEQVGSEDGIVPAALSNTERLRRKLLDRLSAAISERGLTQTDAAMIAGVDQPTLSKALSGRLQNLTLDRVIGWLNAFGDHVDLVDTAAQAISDRPSEARLDWIQQASYVCLWERDLVSGRNFWSAGAYDLYGWPRDLPPPTYEQWLQLIHPEDREKAVRAREELAPGADYYENELRVLRPDGEVRWVINRSRIERNDAGEIVCAHGVNIDVTDRRRVEQAWRSSEQRTAMVLDSVSDAFYALDAGWAFTHFNGAAERYFGKTRREVVGRSFLDVFPAARGSLFETNFTRAMAGETVSFETESTAFPGRQIELRTSPLPDGGIAVAFSDITERKRAERELLESRERLQLAQDATRIGTYEYWVESGRMHWSDEVYRIYGLDQRETPPGIAEWQLLVHPEDRHRTDLRAQAGPPVPGLTYHTDFRVVHPNGAIRWVESRTKVIGDPDRGDLRWVGVNIDITERKCAEETLRESESRFRLIADSAPVPMWVTRLDRRREFVNRAYVEFLGISYDEAIDYDWRHVIHPDDLPRIYAEQVEKEAALRPFTLEARYRNAAGEWRWLRSESQPRWASDGTHMGFIGVAYDVTIAKEAELSLQALVEERTAELQALYTRTPTLLHSQSPDGRVISVSDRWLEFMGYSSRDEVIGRPIKDFMAAECYEAHDRVNMPRLQSEGGFDDVEYKALKKNGETADMLVSSRIWYDAEGRFARTMAAMVDVTGKRRTEEALRQAQKVEAMGQLTGGVAHDFNNLLSPIIGGLDFLQRREVGGEREQRMIAGALQAAERAKTLVQRLLAFARRQPLQPTSIDLRQLVGGMEALIASTMGPRIRVKVDVPQDLPPAFADGNQIEMALLNLSVNARDAMPDGGKLRIVARARHIAAAEDGLAPGEYLCLAVSDDGVGMDEATLARAIEPFFSTKGIGRGTGLGLSMVHGLAAQLGGALRLRSAPNAGTTVELLLPAAMQAVTSSAEDAPEADSPRVGRALLIDDEELVRGSTAAMLEELGYEVVQFDSASAALAQLNSGLEADLIVTDHLMPDLTGAELARRIREARPNLPVLIVSGYAETDGIAADLPRLAKPFRQTDLARSIAKLPEPV